MGPGDPELVTVKAARLIGQAQVVAYHAARPGRSLARASAAPYLPADVVEEELVYPVTRGAPSIPVATRARSTSSTSSPPPGSPGTWPRAGTSCCSPRATRRSTAPSPTCSAGSPRGSGAWSSPG
nr:SAM-dependent methyltransferase [Parafrankia sp. CH37]